MKISELNLIDKGGFSEVYLCRSSETNELVVKKVLCLKNSDDQKKKRNICFTTKNELLNEISSLTELKLHNNIVRLHSYYYLPEVNEVSLIFEYCDGGNLNTIVNENIKSKSMYLDDHVEKVTKYYLNQLKNALVYMHRNNFIHRDIKSENILLKKNFLSKNKDIFQWEIKLSDFGFSTKFEMGENFVEEMYSFYYIAPEMLAMKFNKPGYLEKKNYNSKTLKLIKSKLYELYGNNIISSYNYKIDIWSFGIVFYKLLTGQVPFFHSHIGSHCKSNNDHHQSSVDLLLSMSNIYIDDYSSECRNLLSNCLKIDPNQRITWERINIDSFFKQTRKNILLDKIYDKSKYLPEEKFLLI